MLGKKLLWDPARCVHWRFQVENVYRYYELTLRNGDGLEGVGLRVSIEGEYRVFLDVFSPLGMRPEYPIIELRMKLGD